MKIRPSLVIKKNGSDVVVNICVGDHSIGRGESKDLDSAIGKALDGTHFPLNIKNVLISVDFTHMLSRCIDFSKILYVKVLPSGTSQIKTHQFTKNSQDISERVLNFTLQYDFKNGFLNIDTLFTLIRQIKPEYIALNSPFFITQFNIERTLIELFKTNCPDRKVYSSRDLMSRSFMSRGNILLYNLILKARIEQYIKNLKTTLVRYHINCPLYFLRSNGGMIGERTVLTRGMDTYGCEQLSFLFDTITMHPYEFMYVTDWRTKSLYYVHNRKPKMLRAPIEFDNFTILRDIPVRYSLDSIDSPARLLELLDMHNPFPGPIPIISVGELPLKIPKMFEYAVTIVNPQSHSQQCGISALLYLLEMEEYENSTQSISGVKKTLIDTLYNIAEKDGIRTNGANCRFERVPMKYLNDDQYIIRASLHATVGEAL